MSNKVHDTHHRLPRSQGGSNRRDNLVRVPQDLHRAWHLLFRNDLPPDIAKHINDTWICKRWRLVAFDKQAPKGQKRRTRRVSKAEKLEVLHECDEYVVLLKKK